MSDTTDLPAHLRPARNVSETLGFPQHDPLVGFRAGHGPPGREALQGADEVEAEAFEVPGVAGAVPVPGLPGDIEAVNGLPQPAALHLCGVGTRLSSSPSPPDPDYACAGRARDRSSRSLDTFECDLNREWAMRVLLQRVRWARSAENLAAAVPMSAEGRHTHRSPRRSGATAPRLMRTWSVIHGRVSERLLI